MTLDELKAGLTEIATRNGGDPESDHLQADSLLIDYINDPEVERLFDSINKWYS